MRYPLKDFSHQLKLLLAELRHTAERTIAPDRSSVDTVQQFSQLEQRLMMSASPAAVAVPADAAESSTASSSIDELLDQVFENDEPVNVANQAASSSQTNQPDTASSDSSATQQQLVIIDSTILNPDEWVAGLRQDSAIDFEILILSEDGSGFDQITNALDGSTLYSAVHVVSHGTNGQISLGQSTLDLNSLQQNQSVLASWQAGLAAGADVLIYGCDLAESEEGQQLVNSLADTLQADVAASDDLTGHQTLNGDWDLEYQVGIIDTQIAFSAAHTESWVGVLMTNAAPVNSIPDGQTVLQDRILSFNDANGNAISVSDSDAGGNDLQLTLEASAGSFSITDIGTAEFTTGDGFDDSILVLQGTQSELNSALQTLHFTADAGFVGAVDLTITTNDLGNGGAQSAEQDSDIISVVVHDELVSGQSVVADTPTDELNRNANRGVARSLAVTADGSLISVYRTSTDNVFFEIQDRFGTSVGTGQINDVGISAADVSVASGNNGEFVVSWSQGDAANQDIFAQRYSPAGVAIGSRITVDASAGIQQAVTIDQNAAGAFVVAWETAGGGIQARRFAADGTAIDSVALSPPLGAGGLNASVGIDRDLNILLGWNDSNGQYIQRFDGTAWGTRHTLSTETDASGSAIGINESGQAVIAWHFTPGNSLGNSRVAFQLISENGSPIGTATLADSVPGGIQQNASVALDEAGNFVIAWETNSGIQARRFATDGSSLGNTFTAVNGLGFENNAAVAVLDLQNFAVLHTNQTSNADVFVTRFNTAAIDAAAPVIDVVEQTIGFANSTITQAFLVGDDVTNSADLMFSVTSSDPALIAVGNISITGTGLQRNLVINPTSNMIGSSDITVTVTDGDQNVSEDTITVFVTSPTVTVTTTADELDGDVTSILALLANSGGTGISLREAITAANNTNNFGGPDRIEFDIAGASQQTITLTSELPDIIDSLSIDGQTQPGHSGSPLIELNGNGSTGNGLTIAANDVAVSGLAIFGFQQLGADVDTGNGILIQGAERATISSNYIGTDASGLIGNGNDRDGIRIIGNSSNNVIGGEGQQQRNVISGNNGNGITLLGDPGGQPSANEIKSNFIGVGADGITDIGNSFVGVQISHASQTQISNNVISGNGNSGIELRGESTTENQILGNFIGVAADGTTAVGNDFNGIVLSTFAGQGPAQTKIGGLAAGEANIIANNSTTGVRLDSGGGVGNSIRGNRIFQNQAGLGIDLVGVNTNDLGDIDSGTNDQQNRPVITVADFQDGDLTIEGSLNSTPNSAFDIDVYSSVTADSSGSGEAETFVGTLNVITDNSGNATFSQVFTGAATSAGQFITATATNSTSSTSEFAVNQIVTAVGSANAASPIPQNALFFSSVLDVDSTTNTTGISEYEIEDVVVLSDPNLNLGTGTTQGHLSTAFSVQTFVQDGNALISGLHVVSRDITVGTATSVALQAGDILFSTANSETYNGGSLVTDSNDIVLFRPDSQFDYSSGTFSILVDGIENGQIAAFTLIEQATTIGNTVVDAGDFLFVTTSGFGRNDIVLYEVDDVGQNTSGTATQILDGSDIGISSLGTITALELVEDTTTIGGVTLNSGTVLIASTNSPTGLSTNNNDVVALNVTETEIESGITAATSSLIVHGDDIGVSWISSLSLGNQPVQVTSLSAVADTTLHRDNQDTNFGNDTSLVVDKGGSGLGSERTAVRFDLSSLPSGAVITSAYLRLEATSVTDPLEIEAYELIEGWDENTATYNNASLGTPFTTAGGTVNSTVLDAVTVDSPGAYQWDITSLVESWQNGTSVNNGVLLGSSQTGNEDAQFGSRESSAGPQLVIEFTTPASPPNSAPVASAGGPYIINEGSTLNLDASGTTDSENDSLTYAWDLDNDGAFDDATGVNPSINWNALPPSIQDDGIYTVRVSVSDGVNPPVIATTTLTVNNVAPTGNFDSGTGFETDADSTLTTSSVVANDSDPAGANDPILVTGLDSTGTIGQVSIASGNTAFEYNPNGQFDSLRVSESITDTFTYSISDGDGGTTSNILVTIVINGVNDAPTAIQLDNLTVTENSTAAVVGTLSTTDVDASDVHTYTVSDNRFEVIGSQLRLRAGQSVDFESESMISIDVTSTDLGSLNTTETFILSVTDVNDVAPAITAGQTFSVPEQAADGFIIGTVNATDVDSNPPFANWTIVSGNDDANFQINASTGQLTLATGANLDFSVQNVFMLGLTVSDGVNTSATQNITIEVTAPNQPLMISTIDDQIVTEDSTATTVSFSLLNTGPSSLIVTAVSSDNSLIQNSSLTLSGTGLSRDLSFVPATDQSGSTTITVTVSDGTTTAQESFNVIVNPANDAPELESSDLILAVSDRSLLITETALLAGASDIDSANLQLVLNTTALQGQLVEVNPGEYLYTPEVGFLGQDQFSYSITDGALQSQSRTVTIDVPISVPSPGPATPRNSPSPSDNTPNETEVDDNSSSPDDTTSETGDEDPNDSNSNTVDLRLLTEEADNEPDQQVQDDHSGGTDMTQLVVQPNMSFAFRKLITTGTNEVQSTEGTSERETPTSVERQAERRNQHQAEEALTTTTDHFDWQYYSDIKSTVGSVQVFRENLHDEFSYSDLTTGTITLASTGAAVGFVVTAVRSGMLALGFLSQLPVWTLFDPLMVVDGVTGEETDQDSIHDIVDRQSAFSDSNDLEQHSSEQS